jgi:hypothetical protein
VVAALADPLNQGRMLQLGKPIIDPGLLAAGGHQQLGDGEAGRAGVGEHGQQPSDFWVCAVHLGRCPAARAGRCRVGVAATVLCAWSHPGRCRSDAAFAMLGGAAPIPASSGQTVRFRLNRSGDRQLNQALYTVVLTRLRTDSATRAYATRRRAQGKTNREIKRCLIAMSPASSTGSSRRSHPVDPT